MRCESRMNGKHIRAKCDVCGDELYTRAWRKHVAFCKSLPIEKIHNEYINDELSSITKLSNKYKVGHQRLRKILVHSFGWTVEDMYKKGIDAKNLKLKKNHENGVYNRNEDGTIMAKEIEDDIPRCICGIIVSKNGIKCKWCVLESNGIKSYHDMYKE